jgi:hypothetical protein
MPLDFDVVIEADPALLPFRIEVGLDRQRLEGWALDLIEQRAPAGPQVPCHAVVELRDQFPDGGVELGQREEAPIAQLRGDPTSRNLNRNFNFRFGESRQMLVVLEQRWGKKSASRTSSILSRVTQLR